MTTIVFLHAHPDDETTQTSGSMARATDQGDRVVVVYATNGDYGDAPEDLRDGDGVGDVRLAALALHARVGAVGELERPRDTTSLFFRAVRQRVEKVTETVHHARIAHAARSV